MPLWTTDAVCLVRDADKHCIVHNIVQKQAFDLAHVPPSAALCVKRLLGFCLVHPAVQMLPQIFGFATFVTALTLLSVVFTVSDFRFKFRIAVAPFPLLRFSVFLTAIIGFLALYSDVAFSLQLLMPASLANALVWQATDGSLFFSVVIVWMYFGLLRPPAFGRWNALRFTRYIYQLILKGDDGEMRVAAHELGLSAKNIISICSDVTFHRRSHFVALWRQNREKLTNAEKHAHALLLLIGTRRVCRYIVSNAPGTAIAFFTELSKSKKYRIPIDQLAINIATEAMENEHSLLYDENDGFNSSVLGHWKPLSQAIFGDYVLVEALGERFSSPLDINYFERRNWNAEQLDAFVRAVLITLKSYIETGNWRRHSPSLSRAMHAIRDCARDLYKIDGSEGDIWENDAYARFCVAVRFVKDAIDLIEKMGPTPPPQQLRLRRNQMHLYDMYDELADLAYHLIETASYVRRLASLSWSIQYNTVWSEFFGTMAANKTWSVIQFKIRRRIYDEITKFDFLNYLTARVLGMSLNVLGIRPIHSKDLRDRTDYALRCALLAWTRRTLMKCWDQSPEVVESGLPENLQINARYKRLIRTYPKFLERKPKIVYFQLN